MSAARDGEAPSASQTDASTSDARLAGPDALAAVSDSERLAVLVDAVELVERWLAAGASTDPPAVRWPAPTDEPLEVDAAVLHELRARIDLCVVTAQALTDATTRELDDGSRRRTAVRRYLAHQPR